MKKNELEIHLQKINVDLYSYACCLIPDELQASQLVLDAFTVLTVDKNYWLKEILEIREESEKRVLLFTIKKFLYQKILNLADKRLSQIRSSVNFSDSFSAFHGLNLEQKSALFFKSKTSLDFSDIREILGMEKPELIALLTGARQLLAVRSGVQTEGVFS